MNQMLLTVVIALSTGSSATSPFHDHAGQGFVAAAPIPRIMQGYLLTLAPMDGDGVLDGMSFTYQRSSTATPGSCVPLLLHRMPEPLAW